MATELLNKEAYTIDADNLVLGNGYPVVRRAITITNPQVALKRGMAVIRATASASAANSTQGGDAVTVTSMTNTLYVAGAKSGGSTIPGDIVGVIAADYDADTTSETVSVDAFVSGAFNIGKVKTLNSLSISTAAYVLGAQGNGIYLL